MSYNRFDPRPRTTIAKLLPLSLLLGTFLAIAPASTAQPMRERSAADATRVAASDCTRYASLAGNDRRDGSRGRPFRTVSRLASALRAGETGCLFPGVYAERVVIRRGGSPGAPLKITSAQTRPRATIFGIVEVTDDANHVTLDNLRLDGTNRAMGDGVLLKIFGDHVRVTNNDIFSGALRICVLTGDQNFGSGTAYYPVIDRNRIHGCGHSINKTVNTTFPSGHALYMQSDRHARVTNNVIYDMGANEGGVSGGRGIQIWPDSQYATIEHNVIDGANEWNVLISGGSGPNRTRGTRVRFNVLTRARSANLSSTWLQSPPTGDIEVSFNCVYGAPVDFHNTTWEGKEAYLLRGNIRADPRYVNRAKNDFRLRRGSPCARMGPVRR
jgi:hypothetical protein